MKQLLPARLPRDRLPLSFTIGTGTVYGIQNSSTYSGPGLSTTLSGGLPAGFSGSVFITSSFTSATEWGFGVAASFGITFGAYGGSYSVPGSGSSSFGLTTSYRDFIPANGWRQDWLDGIPAPAPQGTQGSPFAIFGLLGPLTNYLLSFAPHTYGQDTGAGPAGANGAVASLTQQQLNAVLQTATALWQSVVVTPTQPTVTIELANLPDGVLGESRVTAWDALGHPTAGVIDLSPNAAGQGWFVNPTPDAGGAFADALSSNASVALPGSAAFGHYDLLTVLVHELGHILGFYPGTPGFDSHLQTVNGAQAFVGAGFTVPLSAASGTDEGDELDPAVYPYDVMAQTLPPGMRRLPSPLDVAIIDTVWNTLAPLPTATTASVAGPAAPPDYIAFQRTDGLVVGNDTFKTRGDATVVNDVVTLTGDTRFNSDANTTFTVPAGVDTFQFTISKADLLRNGLLAPGDAFEVALLNANTMQSLVGTAVGLTNTDAFLNIQQTGQVFYSPVVTIADVSASGQMLNLDGSITVTVNLSGVQAGTQARLYFDLLGFGADNSNVVVNLAPVESVVPGGVGTTGGGGTNVGGSTPPTGGTGTGGGGGSAPVVVLSIVVVPPVEGGGAGGETSPTPGGTEPTGTGTTPTGHGTSTGSGSTTTTGSPTSETESTTATFGGGGGASPSQTLTQLQASVVTGFNNTNVPTTTGGASSSFALSPIVATATQAVGGTLIAYDLGFGTADTSSGSGGVTGAGEDNFWPWVPQQQQKGTETPESAPGGGDQAFWPWLSTIDADAQGGGVQRGTEADGYWPWLGASDEPTAAPTSDGVFSTLDGGDTLVNYDGRDEVVGLAESLAQPACAGNAAEPTVDALFAASYGGDGLPAGLNGDGSTLPAAGWTRPADQAGVAWAGLLAVAAGLPLARPEDERRKRVGR